MDKKEILSSVKKQIEELANEIASLKSNAEKLSCYIENDSFIPNDISANTVSDLISIKNIQEKCRKNYALLMGNESIVPESILEFEKDISNKEYEIDILRKYVETVDMFLNLHSKCDYTEKLLNEEKENINLVEISEIGEEKCEEKYRKYITFIEMYNEKDQIKLVEYIQKLNGFFNSDLIARAVFEKDNFFVTKQAEPNGQKNANPKDDAEKENIANEELNATAGKEPQEGMESETPSEANTPEEMANNTDDTDLASKDSGEAKKNEYNDDEYWQHLKEKLEKEYPFEINISDRSLKSFGVKSFKNDISCADKKVEILRKTVLKLCFKTLCADGKMLNTVCDINDEDISQKQCEYLVNKGYLCTIDSPKFDKAWSLTQRGIKIFKTKDAMSFMNANSSIKIKHSDNIEKYDINNSIHVICALMYIKLFNQLLRTDDKADEIIAINPGKYVIIELKKEDKLSVYMIVVDMDNESYKMFTDEMKVITNGFSEVENLNIFGVDAANTEKIIELFPDEIKYHNLFTYNLEEDMWRDKSGNEVIFQEENIENVEKGNKEPDAGSKKIPDVKQEETEEKDVTDEPEEQEIAKEQENKSTDQRSVPCKTPAVKKSPCIEEELTPLEEIDDTYKQMICEDSIYCATAYLKAASEPDASVAPLYKKLGYAVNDPFLKCSYTSDTIINMYFEESSVINSYFSISAVLRNYFMNHIGYDYSMQQLYEMIKNNEILNKNNKLSELIYELFRFKADYCCGIDKYADYRVKDAVEWEKKLGETQREAKSVYDNYIIGHTVERAAQKRFIETQNLIFSRKGDLANYFQGIIDDDREIIDLLVEFLQTTFIKDETQIASVNIDRTKIGKFIDKYWEEAGHAMMVERKSSDLMGSLRMNLVKRVEKAVAILCDWAVLKENSTDTKTDNGAINYKKKRTKLISYIEDLINILNIEVEEIRDKDEMAGRKVLLFTLEELHSRLEGTYSELKYKYFYINFLESSFVMLNSEYLPEITEYIHELGDFSPMKRIVRHFKEPKISIENRLNNLFSSDDYGSAQLLIEYARDMNIGDGYSEEEKIIADNIKRLKANAEMKRDDFIGTLELAESYGKIDNTIEDKKEKILRSVNEWYVRCDESNNYGFFAKILDEFNNKITKEAKKRGKSIKNELDSFCKDNKEVEENEILSKRIEKIREMIENQNYTVAEDLMRRLSSDETETEIEQLDEDFLNEFVEQYDYNYKLVCNQREKLEKAVMINNRARKETKHGRRMIENWPYAGHMGETKLFNLLMAMGFFVGRVEKKEKISGKLETYDVYIQKAENGRKNNYKHPISAFGSRAIENGFRVVCLYGKYDADSLIDTFKEIGNSKNCIVLLDFSLTLDDRRRLARKVKSEVPEKIFGVIDRVMLIYLVNNAKETSVNRMLMSVTMPYTYYQPYVVSSTDTMPPEIFIGRKDELNKIESPEGVNIVYGGRQLGKSALLKMAKNDINFDENGDRAVLVDVKGLDYKKAAKKIASELCLEHIFDDSKITDDWDELAMNIKERLTDEKNKIPYLLLLIDEADAFIESCEAVNFKPFDALKDIQSIGQERFKFVVAGLRNIVRFNRNVALGNNSVLTHLSSITIKPFNTMEAKELLEIPLFYLGLRFPKENDALVSTILATTNYFPGLIQLYCMKLLEAMKKPDYAGYNEADTPPYNVMEKHIKRVLAESGFQQNIRDKFMITLKVDADDFYYVIALLTAYLYHEYNSEDGYSPSDIRQIAKEFGIAKIENLTEEKVNALMDEMSELNIFRITASGKYLFTRYSFFQMMGTKKEIEDEMENYME